MAGIKEKSKSFETLFLYLLSIIIQVSCQNNDKYSHKDELLAMGLCFLVSYHIKKDKKSLIVLLNIHLGVCENIRNKNILHKLVYVLLWLKANPAHKPQSLLINISVVFTTLQLPVQCLFCSLYCFLYHCGVYCSSVYFWPLMFYL